MNPLARADSNPPQPTPAIGSPFLAGKDQPARWPTFFGEPAVRGAVENVARPQLQVRHRVACNNISMIDGKRPHFTADAGERYSVDLVLQRKAQDVGEWPAVAAILLHAGAARIR